jgi:DNA-binding winged helix-turn-helix (wHTH) protein
VEIRSDRFQAFVAGRSLELTRREFELIELLAGGEGRVLEREEIYSRLWGYAMVRGDRSVDVFVRKLRQKLEKASPEWRYIHTHFGIGYRFAAEPADGGGATGPAGQGDPTLAAPKTGALDGLAAPKTGALDGDVAGVRDQGELGGAEQKYELTTASA